MGDDFRISHQALIAAIQRALAAEGLPDHVRQAEAEIMAESDLLGVPSHGVRLLRPLVKALRSGQCHGDPVVRAVRERAAVAVLDGDVGPGRYVSLLGTREAVERARTYGLGACAVAEAAHWGRAHHYAYRIAQAGMIGLCTTNAIPNMLAWGSARPVLGNNPLAIGVPRADGRDPMVLDIAMSQAAVGKIVTYLFEGKPVPEGWGLDKEGRPTTDAGAIISSGLVLPMGGHKGAGLALMMEILSAGLAGGPFSQVIAQGDASGFDPNSSKFFLALDVGAFVEPAAFVRRVEEMIEYLRENVGEQFLFPGERGWRARERNLIEGIPIHARVLEQLKAVGIELAG